MSSKNPVYDFIPNFKDIEGKKIFTCSDSHVSHKNIVYGLSDWGNKDGCRNFSTQDGHDDCIIDGINSIVGKSDILIHCGDWTFGGKDNGYEIQVLEPDTPWKFNPEECAKRNTHGVPLQAIERMLARWTPTEEILEKIKNAGN